MTFGTDTRSALYWLGPELVKEGFVRNEAWVKAHADEMERAYRCPELQKAAVLLAALHPRAIDYLRQAPVLAFAACNQDGLFSMTAKHRRVRAESWLSACYEGPKLRAMMDRYALAYGLRPLAADALEARHLDALLHVAAVVDASTLAQIMPSRAIDQCAWADSVTRFFQHYRRRAGAPGNALLWAAKALSVRICSDPDFPPGALVAATDEVADWMAACCLRPDMPADLGWHARLSWPEARARSDRWHATEDQLTYGEKFRGVYGIGFEDPVDYASLPDRWEAGGLEFIALRSGAQLADDGRAMHHCVAGYAGDVIRGSSRIYSVRELAAAGGEAKRVATLELGCELLERAAIGRASELIPLGRDWRINQLKGPCNAAVKPHVRHGASAFVKFIREAERESASQAAA